MNKFDNEGQNQETAPVTGLTKPLSLPIQDDIILTSSDVRLSAFFAVLRLMSDEF